MDTRGSVSASLSKARALRDELPELEGNYNSSSARRAHAQKIFGQFDKDKSGGIDRIEFKKIIQASEIGKGIADTGGNSKALRRHSKQLFSLADEDKTKRIDFDEFFAFYEKNFHDLVGKTETKSKAEAAVLKATSDDAQKAAAHCEVSGMVMKGEIDKLQEYFKTHPEENFSRSCIGGVPPIVLAAHREQWPLVRFLLDQKGGPLDDGHIAEADREAIRKKISDGDMGAVQSQLDTIYTTALDRCDMMIAFTNGDIDLDKAQSTLQKQRHLRRNIRAHAHKDLPKLKQPSSRRTLDTKFVPSADAVHKVSHVNLTGVKKSDKSLLLAAARGDMVKVVDILNAAFKNCSAKGKDFSEVVDCVDNMNTTPLMHASAFGFPDLVSLLLKFRADASRQDTMLSTALSIAAERDHVDVIEVLCRDSKGVTCLWKTNKLSRLPFAAAKRQYTKERLQFWMKQHPKKGVKRQDSKRHMDLLREKHQSTSHEQKQLALAAIVNDTDYLLATIAQDPSADVLHSVDQYGLTALMHAAAYRNLDACKCLLKNTPVKLNPKQQSTLGNTVLHFAVEGGNKELVAYLLKKGFAAASTIKNKDGKVPKACTARR